MTAHAPARSLAEQFAPAFTRGRVAQASLFTTVRGGALALSVCAHVAIVAVGLHDGHAAAAPAAPSRAALIETPAPELEPLPPDAEPVEPSNLTARTGPASERVTHAAVARAAANVPAAASPIDTAAHAVAAPSPEPLVTTAESAAPRFVLPAAAVAAAVAVNERPAQGANTLGAAVSAPLSEREVDVAARLVAGAPPAYTASAEAAGVEASVPVELVIDETGSVKSAVVLGHVGYGLDEAALGAVRKYRFSPARRGGKVVSVRMRWLVRFELG